VPATGAHIPGKFVWADLVTNRFEQARDFYLSMFRLTWQPVKPPPEPYGIFYREGLPVAGLAFHEGPPGPGGESAAAYGRWIHYMSVEDVAEAEQQVRAVGGQTVLARRRIDDRGEFAVVAGPDQALLGLMRSASGDPVDYSAGDGEWLWRELYTQDPDGAARLVEQLCDCEVFHRDEPAQGRYLVASGGFLRAGINQLDNAQDHAPTWLGYIRVRDLPEMLSRTAELGGSVVLAPTPQIAEGSLAIIRDPAGAYLGLVSWHADDGGEARQ